MFPAWRWPGNDPRVSRIARIAGACAAYARGVSRKIDLMRSPRAWLLVAVAAALASGCVYYPAPYYTVTSPSTYDRAWSAAVGALQDAGVRVASADANAGVARGTRDGADVTLMVVRQSDGTTRVQLDAKSSQNDPGLVQRFSEAYERRMGR